MGVWERSPAGIAIAMANPSLVEGFRRALPDFAPADVVGSPYCIRDYEVDARLGGPEGLAAAREALARHGLGLILDFVPNHVAPDHPWLAEHPEYFVRGDEADLERDPASFVRVGDVVVANGRDPYFPAWPDVVQLDAFSADLRGAVTATLRSIATQCDGVRCDMAMLVTNDVFERTWGGRAAPRPESDYWPTVIPDREGRSTPASCSSPRRTGTWSGRSSSRASTIATTSGSTTVSSTRAPSRCTATSAPTSPTSGGSSASSRTTTSRARRRPFPEPKARAAAVATLSQTGARLVHEGQLDGRTVQLPVFLGRRPDEPVDVDLRAFYERLLAFLGDGVFREGEWTRAERGGWDGNESWGQLVGWGWRGASRKLVVVNLGDEPAEGRVSHSVGRHPRHDVASRRRGRRQDVRTEAATTSATGCTSRFPRGASISST